MGSDPISFHPDLRQSMAGLATNNFHPPFSIFIFYIYMSNFGLLVLASGLIADYQHQLDNYLVALQAISVAATLPSTWFNKYTLYLLR